MYVCMHACMHACMYVNVYVCTSCINYYITTKSMIWIYTYTKIAFETPKTSKEIMPRDYFALLMVHRSHRHVTTGTSLKKNASRTPCRFCS